MTDEPRVPPEPGIPEQGPSQDDLDIEALADEIAAEEAEEAEGSAPAGGDHATTEWDGSAPEPPAVAVRRAGCRSPVGRSGTAGAAH